MLRVTRTTTVGVPGSEVFSYLSDFTNTMRWDPGTISTTRTSKGKIAKGATFHNVSEFRGKRTELDYTLTTYDPASRLVFAGHNDTATTSDDLSFASSGSITAITYQATFRFHGVARLAEPFLRPGLNRLADETIEQLRATIEDRFAPAATTSGVRGRS